MARFPSDNLVEKDGNQKYQVPSVVVEDAGFGDKVIAPYFNSVVLRHAMRVTGW